MTGDIQPTEMHRVEPPSPADDPGSAIDVAAVARGEAAALDTFYRELFEPVYAFVYWRVGGVRQDAEDVTQETFVTALATLGRFEGRSALSTWVCGIARNLAHARVRSRARNGVTTGDRTPGHDGTPERLLERAQTDRLVGLALTELPPHYQRALLEKYVQQKSFVEMAADTRSTAKAVEGTVQRAKRALTLALARLGVVSREAGDGAGDSREDGGAHG
jgi:RNA polymerase sigma-70 factor (ECF subfamily)